MNRKNQELKAITNKINKPETLVKMDDTWTSDKGLIPSLWDYSTASVYKIPRW